MAGQATRTQSVSGGKPKYLINIEGYKPMISYVLDFLRPLNFLDTKYIFLIQREAYNNFKNETDEILDNYLFKNHYEIILVDGQTEGAACTALLAKKYLKLFRDEELILTNSDQFINNFDIVDFVNEARKSYGTLLTFPSDGNPKWSFSRKSKINNYNNPFPVNQVVEVVEKQILPGNWEANVGLYYWKGAQDFIDSCEEMIRCGQKVNNEYYISISYNYLIKKRREIQTYLIPAENMWGLGTSEDILAARQYFLDKQTEGDKLKS